MTSRTLTILAATAVAGSLAAGAALAHGKGEREGMRRGPDLEQMFGRFDTNGDGTITREEFDTPREARFAAADSDGDGKLSAEEMLARAQERAKARIDAMIATRDTDGDGMLSPDEMPQPRAERRARMFERLDADGDGSVTMAEAEAAMQRFMERRHGGPGRGTRDE